MGRRQSKRQPPYSTPPRQPERAGWESDVIGQGEHRAAHKPLVPESPSLSHPFFSPVPPTPSTNVERRGWDNAGDDAGEPDHLPSHLSYSVAAIDPRELELRELAIAVREADLQARRRETAREIRRIRKQAPKIESRLRDIELLIAELAQAALQLGHAKQEALPSDHAADERRLPSSDDVLLDEMRGEIESLHSELDSLRRQNEELAGELAQAAVRHSINKSSDADATLTWEQRKALLFSQDQDNGSNLDHTALDDRIKQELTRLNRELESRDDELAQLRDLLEQRPTQCEDGMAVGAAAIAQMMDSDELIREERQRLLDLQTEWEAKFREMEISASIERANLARERQQLERQNAELEEQLAHLKRELKQEEITGPNQSRRWLAKLGLAE